MFRQTFSILMNWLYRLSISSKDFRNDRTLISFCIKDTGSGIRKEDQSKLFEKYQLLESSLVRMQEG